jgi:hypothetical protein
MAAVETAFCLILTNNSPRSSETGMSSQSIRFRFSRIYCFGSCTVEGATAMTVGQGMQLGQSILRDKDRVGLEGWMAGKHTAL